MALPWDLAQMPAKDGEEAEDLDAEKGEAEDMRSTCESRCKHGRSHKSSIGRQRCRKSMIRTC